MKLAARVYGAFTDDEEKARVLAEAVEELERHILGVATKATSRPSPSRTNSR
jgi:hypothetical protein